MQLDDFLGRHVLTGVDFGVEKATEEYYQDANTMAFEMDGKVYLVREDPDDGYRSSMKDIEEVDIKVVNQFPPCKVKGRRRKNSEYGEKNDVIDFYDVVTGLVVLAIGTENIDDYYPSYVAYFDPRNMKINIPDNG